MEKKRCETLNTVPRYCWHVMEYDEPETLDEADEQLTEFAEEIASLDAELSAAVVWARNHSQVEDGVIGNRDEWQSGSLPFESREDEIAFAAGMMVGSLLHSKHVIFTEQQNE